MTLSRPAIGLFAKPATPDGVKTRLVPPLRPTEAAALYAAFLEDLAHTLDGDRSWDWVVFSTDPAAQEASWPVDAPRPASWRAQSGPDLGGRMDRATTSLLEEGRPAAVLVGSDHPTLGRETLREAIEALRAADLVLGPSLDGGYYLVGLTRPLPEIFRDIPWSTPRVFSTTLDRIRAAGFRAAFLPPWYDVDRPEDLRFLGEHLRALELQHGDAAPCPATRKKLASLLPRIG